MKAHPWPSRAIQQLFGIRYPVVQGGMVWAAGWRLCAAVSRAGCLGQIGAGSMSVDLLREHIRKARADLRDEFPFAVNVPLQRGDAEQLIETCIEEGVRILFTSAGNPGLFTSRLKEQGIVVTHVAPTAKMAAKCEQRGVDAVVCEGTEAGGHNGLDEITTFALVPQVRDALSIPVIAAGGIVDGRGIAAALALGADGVQIGTRFAATVESSASDRYKQAVVEAGETDTVLSLKNVVPTRMIRNPFANQSAEYEKRGASHEETTTLLDEGRERRGIFEGDWNEGQFEASMASGLIGDVPTVADAVKRMLEEYHAAVTRLTASPRVEDPSASTKPEQDQGSS